MLMFKNRSMNDEGGALVWAIDSYFWGDLKQNNEEKAKKCIKNDTFFHRT